MLHSPEGTKKIQLPKLRETLRRAYLFTKGEIFMWQNKAGQRIKPRLGPTMQHTRSIICDTANKVQLGVTTAVK